jgi:hypothetical protein
MVRFLCWQVGDGGRRGRQCDRSGPIGAIRAQTPHGYKRGSACGDPIRHGGANGATRTMVEARRAMTVLLL